MPLTGSVIMKKHVIAILVLLAIATVVIVKGLQHSSATGSDKLYGLVHMLGGLALFSVPVGVAVETQRTTVRKYAIAIAASTLMLAFFPMLAQKYRIESTKSSLADQYAKLSRQGPPFPVKTDAPELPRSAVLISHGYWVAADRTRFEVYYHVGSDSFTMPYPDGQWEWRGNRYQGPEETP